MSDEFPSYKDFDYDEHERNLQRVTPGPFIVQVTFNDAMNYIYKDAINKSIILYTLAFIHSQVAQKGESKTYFVTQLEELEGVLNEKPKFAIIIALLKNKLYGLLWDSQNLQTIMIKRNDDLLDIFKDQQNKIIQITTVDILPTVAAIFIRAINQTTQSEPFREREKTELIKWALTKQYRILQQKEKGESFSRLLDDNLLQEVNEESHKSGELAIKLESKSQSKHSQFNQSSVSKISKNKSNSQLKPLSQSRYTEPIKDLSSNISINNLKEQITERDLTQMLGDFKKQILNNQFSSESNLQPRNFVLKPIIPYASPDEVVRLKVEDLETILREQVKNKKIENNQPIDDLQQLLSYYYQTNQEQYKLLLNQYSHLIHEKMFENMGLPNTTPQPQPQLYNFGERQSIRNNQSNSITKSLFIQPQSKLQPKLFQEEIMAIKYNRKIHKQEFLLLKEKLVITQNLMEFYFSYLNGMARSILILPVEFYDILSQTNYEKAKYFTDNYQGRNNTIFDLFQKIFVPIKVSQYEYVGIYIEFPFKTMYYVNTVERKDRRLPNYKELIDIPIVQFVIKFIENEYNHKVMRAFNILNWKFVEFQNEYASSFNHSGLVLTYVFDSIINNQNAHGDNKKLLELAQKILDVVRKTGVSK